MRQGSSSSARAAIFKKQLITWIICLVVSAMWEATAAKERAKLSFSINHKVPTYRASLIPFDCAHVIDGVGAIWIIAAAIELSPLLLA